MFQNFTYNEDARNKKILIEISDPEGGFDTGKKNIGVIKKLSSIRILGLMAMISYMIVILFVWMHANYGGYVYFIAGEPDPLIKYTEWLLGFMGIIVAIDLLSKEIKEIA